MAKLSAKLKSSAMEARTHTFKADDIGGLAEYLEDGDDWTVRGLTTSEIHRSQSMVKGGREAIETLVEKLQEGGKKNAEEFAKALTPKIESETQLRCEQLAIASVDPVLDIRQAIAISEAFPIEFLRITTKILELTGMGATEKKPAKSGESTKAA